MATLNEYFQNAELSVAAYADLFPGMSITDYLSALTQVAGMSVTQAREFIGVDQSDLIIAGKGYEIVDQLPTTGSGFSATVFKKNGEYTLAIRGTEGITPPGVLDWLTNINIGPNGIAISQAIDLFNYFQDLKAQQGSTVYHYSYNQLTNQITYTSAVANVTGALYGQAFTATGHSLGGHLALVMTRLAPSLVGGLAYTYNAPGFDPIAFPHPGSEGFFTLLHDAEVSASGSSEIRVAPWDGTNFHNLVVPEDIVHLIGFMPGAQLSQFSELGASGRPINSHDKNALADALAVYSLLSLIDPAKTNEQILSVGTDIFKAASNTAGATLEAMVNSIGDLFATGSKVDIGNRDQLYQRLIDLNTALVDATTGALKSQYQDLTLVDLAGWDTLTIEANAFVDIGYRYALSALNPFAIIEGNSDLYAQFKSAGAKADTLDVYNAFTGSGTLTSQWIEDRAKFLTLKISSNINDRLTELSAASDTIWYQDLGLNANSYVMPSSLTLAPGIFNKPVGIQAYLTKKLDAQRISFGSDNSESLIGGKRADFLYGGGGIDPLSGLDGDDYLQGDAGNDTLRGGAGDDTLFGGKDNDVLDGGLGNDTYIWNTKDGFDTITDAREANGLKSGTIQFLNQTLAGDKTQAQPDNPGLFTDDRGIFYALIGNPGTNGMLTIVKPGEEGGLRIEDFRSGDFGIVIPVPTVITKTDKLGAADNDDLAADTINQKVYGLAGNDRITVAFNNTEAYGGTGSDYITNDAGDQKLYGEAGNDILIATGGNDELYGGLDNDALQGGADDDYLEGNEGNDVIDGGAGSDVLVGGNGNDFLVGGGSLVPNIPVWDPDNPPQFGVLVQNGAVGLNNMVGLLNIDGDSGDMLDGGAGNDTLLAGDGDDYLDGGADDDLLVGQALSDTLFGNDGNDALYGDGSPGSLTIASTDYFTLPEFHGNDYLDGGAGNDFLSGDGGSDELFGGDGDDILVGDANNLDEQYHGADYLDGGAGNDKLYGYGKDDTLFGGAGDDIQEGDSNTVAYALHGNDYLDGEDGNDKLQGDGGSDTLFGGAGNDQLFGDSDDTPVAYQGDDYLDGEDGDDYLRGYGGNDTLFGGEGNDELLAEAGDDYLDGGAGADTMDGGAGNDTYIADFSDTIIDTEGSNTILFAADVSLDSLKAQNLAIDGENYLLLYQAGAPQTIPGIPDGLMVKGELDQLNFCFASVGGAVLTQQQFLGTAFTQDLFVTGTNGNDSLIGYAGNDTLSGYSGNDTLIGGRGDDSLIGYDGSDTYVFNVGDGHDTIQENGLLAIGIPDTQGIDAIRFGAGITAGDVTLTRQADGNLIVAYGSGDRVTVYGQYTNIINSIERIEYDDGTVIDAAALAALPIAPITGSASDDVLSGTTANDTLQGLAGNDTLDGGPIGRFPGQPTGNDRLEGGAGMDRYAMYAGMGQDTLVDASASPEEISTLALNAGLTFDSLKATRDGNDLVVSLRGASDSARIQGYYDEAVPQQWQIWLADGSTIPIDELINRVDPYADSIALQAREDYRQGVLANWNAQSVPLTLPTHALVFQSWSQTTTTYYTNPAFPPQVEVLPPVTTTAVNGYGVRQGNGYAPVYSDQHRITPVTGNQQSDDANIYPVNFPQITAQSILYGVWLDIGELGGGSGISNTYATGQNYVNSTVSYSSTNWRGVALTPNPGTSFAYYFNLNTINEQWVVEQITAGDSNNNIHAALGDRHVALVDAGAGDDYVSADWNDFVYGNDGDDTVGGGYLVYGGDGNDNLSYGTNLYGGAGNDILDGGQVMSGGEGDDVMYGGYGLTQYLINPAEAGEDYIADSAGIETADFEYWYYQSIGIPSIDESWEFGGQYGVIGETGNRLQELNARGGQSDPYYDDSIFSGYEWPSPVYESLSALQAELALYGLPYRGQDIRYIPPLPPAPWIAANAYAELEPLYAAGVIERDTIAFGPGVNPEDVTVTRDVDEITLSWGQGKLLHAALAQPGDKIGTGIERFSFANGETWSIREALNRNLVGTATSGDDDIYFTENADIAYGLDGSDALYTFDGNDTLDGGTGDDYLAGGLGSDTYIFDLGSGQDVIAEFDSRPSDVDTIAFGAGITPESIRTHREDDDLVVMIDGTPDQLTINQWFTNSDYRIERVTFADGTQWGAAILEDLVTAGPISGSSGDNVLDGTSGNDVMFGLDGNDTLLGGTGNDTLVGGAGNDTLDGGAGNDTYMFGLGSSIDTIIDEIGNDTISFGADITPEMLTLGLGSLLIEVGTGGEAIHIEGFDPYDVYGSAVIENFLFADDTSLTYEELIARGIHINGTEGDDDNLTGTNGPDIFDGGAGNDYIYSDAGNDTFIFGRGYGQDVFDDYDETPGNVDTVKFADDITPSDVTVSGNEGNLVLSIAGTDDQVVLAYWFWDDESKIEQVAFADKTVWDVAALESMVPMAEATADADTIFGTSGDDVIDGLGGNDEIVGGSGNDMLSGSAGDDIIFGDRGNDILLGGEDTDDLEDWYGNNYFDGGSGDDFILTDDGASFIIGGSGDDSIEGYSAGNVVAFNAGDGQDTIYAAASLTLSLGGGIHAADLSLRRDGIDLVLEISATDSIRFTPESVQNPDAWPSITLQLIDGAVATYDLNQLINIYNGLEAVYPELSSWPIGDALAFVQIGSSIGSALGGDLAYRYATAGSNDSLTPEWIRTILADPAFGVDPQTFEAWTSTNRAPQIGAPIDAVAATQDTLFAFTLPADTFIDPDANDSLTLSATLADGSALPDWLAFDGTSFSGTPANGDVGSVEIEVTATDPGELSVTSTFTLNVENVNDAPLLINNINKQYVADGNSFNFEILANTFTDVDAGDSLSYDATLTDGAALPTWLAFDTTTRTFSGMPDEPDIGTATINVTATDTSGATASGSFDLEVTVAPDKTLTGTSGDDLLTGRSGNDTLTGLAGNDALIGRSGNDRLTGGPGSDLLDGGTGDDTYVYQAGDGLDTIADESGNDTVVFGVGLTLDNVVARMSGENTTTRIRVLDANGSEQVDQGLDVPLAAGGNSPIEWFTFADGDSASLDGLLIRKDEYYGTRRNDVIRTGRNDDTIYADRGNDTVYAGTGNDVIFGGRGRDILYGEAGNDALIGGRGKDRLYGGYGNDVLEGGRGTDILDGGAGFNTYVFERNFGDDRILNGGGSGALRFGEGISARDFSFKRRNDDLVVKVKGEGRIRIEGWFDDANAEHPVAGAEFADGTVMSADQFVAKGNDSERERDEDDDDDENAGHHGNDNSNPPPQADSHHDDHNDGHAKKGSEDHGKKSAPADDAWFEKVVEKWDARYAHSAKQDANRDDARGSSSQGAQPGNRWQHMHDRLNAHLLDGQGDNDNGGADLASLKSGSGHGQSFAQFGSIGYGVVGVKDTGAADLRPFTGLREGLARIG